MTNYKHVSVMEAKNDGGSVTKGAIHFIPGKKPENHIRREMAGTGEDAHIVGIGFRRLDVLELPRHMSSTDVDEWVDDHNDELVEKYGDRSDTDGEAVA